jgi:hypothetical protein
MVAVSKHAWTVKYCRAPGNTTATTKINTARMRIREGVMRIDP